MLRPPLALPRLERFQGVDGRTMVRIERKRTYSDGTHAIELSAPGLAEKLVAIVPPPRVYTVIYSGVLAANAALRPEVIVLLRAARPQVVLAPRHPRHRDVASLAALLPCN